MKYQSLLYLSRSRLPANTASAEVDKIVSESRLRNRELGLTGALLFTGTHFAQVLEGTASAIDTLMAVVMQDDRHDNIIIAVREPIAALRFASWNMAYCGPSQFVSRHVTALLADPAAPDQARLAQWLNTLIWEFSEGAGAD